MVYLDDVCIKKRPFSVPTDTVSRNRKIIVIRATPAIIKNRISAVYLLLHEMQCKLPRAIG